MNSYLIVFVCFWQQVLSLGMVQTFSAYLKAIQDDYKLSHGIASLFFAICSAIVRMFAPLATIFLQTYGYQKSLTLAGFISASALVVVFSTREYVVFLIMFGGFYGICTSITATATQALPAAQLPQNFYRIGYGIITSGNAAGIIFFPLIHVELLQRYLSWRQSWLLLAGMTLNLIPLGLLLQEKKGIRSNTAIKQMSQRVKNFFKSMKTVFKNVLFLLIIVSTFVGYFILMAFVTFQYSILIDYLQFSLRTTSLIVGIFPGVSSIFGRVLVAMLPAKKVGKQTFVLLYLLSTAIFSVCLYLLIYVGPQQFAKTSVLLTLFGFMLGIFFAAMPISIAETGGKYSVVMIGLATFSGGCGSLIGAITAGKAET